MLRENLILIWNFSAVIIYGKSAVLPTHTFTVAGTTARPPTARAKIRPRKSFPRREGCGCTKACSPSGRSAASVQAR